VFDSFGLSSLKPSVLKKFRDFDCIFTIFGPDYLMFIKSYRVVGFAQPWIIYPKNEVKEHLSVFKRIFFRFKYSVQKYFFKKSDVLVVELSHVREQLSAEKVFDQKRIAVVHNCASNIYRSISENDLTLSKIDLPFKLGLITRNYLHKNLMVVPEVLRILAHTFNKKRVEFHATLTDEEWLSMPQDFRDSSVNHGSLLLEECPSFYSKIDGVLFPSLLECFSATPLEAMAMCKPVFASDRRFNKDICGSFGYYVEPTSPYDIARVINDYIENNWGRDYEVLLEARKYALEFSDPQKRAKDYIKLAKSAINNV
tara:strand:- start:255 stop:1190 length:936 start_codon:yes stop_codon:yes gene_type:complete